MKGSHGKQESEAASVVQVPREAAIILTGVPELPPDCTSGSQPEAKKNAESQVDPRFGEWLEGRKVKKLFGDTHYVGKVVKYDSESNWYNILYDDGDQEDLDLCELEEVLLPLDVTIPLQTLVMDKCKLQGAGPDSRPKVGRPRKVYATMDASMTKISNVVPSQGNDDVMNNQVSMVGIGNSEGQQPNDVLQLLPAPTSNDATGGQLAIVTAQGHAQACLQASNQPRRRGRPRKDASLSAHTPPRKRGRPPKNSSASGNSQSAGNTSDSLALVPVQDGESSRKQNSTLKRNILTARAEKLKRDNLRVHGTSPGTQLF
ncbi:hypothetical protein PR202_ga09130 [Eleusine coracana subsp. coracana]|uniref:PTM/DIR17-like Tudor domain-containing protein n=1 Tax=Eleusine coracana subsp. coracana TaxID=191504 RepID=A0AAV5C3F9_ELECO|nr:hypothetical protein PR202_ga09130 [Eleusine coracana subsp. coracana]